MKRLLLALVAVASLSVQARYELQHVHPLHWYAGMQNPSLQVMLHGTQVGKADVSLSTSEVRIDSIVRPDNANYLLLYLNTQGAQAQTFDIVLRDAKGRSTRVPYELRQRIPGQGRNCFNSSDVLYLIMPDRFANGTTANDRVPGLLDQTLDSREYYHRHGGDLQGIIDHLDYLDDLGVTALWLTPTQINDMPAGSYHGYAITDYYQTDPRLGSNEDYRRMVAAAHQRGIKVVMDLVFNHCGGRNFLIQDLPAKDWFNNASEYIQTSYKLAAITDPHADRQERYLSTDGWFTSEMPDFNQRNPHVMTYLIQTAKWWTEFAGIDGIRQDTYPYCDLDAMARWNLEMEREYPGYNIVGETWVNYNVSVSYWQKDSRLAAPRNTQLRSVMDFPLMYLLFKICQEETDGWDNGFARLYDYLSQDIVYANTDDLLTFLSNHDTSRFCETEEQAANIDRYRQALTLLLTLRGTPQLYYGDEIAMVGNKGKGDGDIRHNFPGGWADADHNAFTAEGRTEREAAYHDFARQLLRYRRGNEVIAHGTLRQFTPREGCYVYARQYGGKTLTVILNGTSQAQTLPLTPYASVLPAQQAREVLTNTSLMLGETLQLEPRAIRILEF